MRLIDADALKEKAFFHEIDNVSYVEEEDIDKAPTISPDMAQVLAYECGKAERKNGKWEQVANDDNGIDFRCSVCHRYRFHNGEMLRKYKFCPNCGADMRGEQDDD